MENSYAALQGPQAFNVPSPGPRLLKMFLKVQKHVD